MDPLTAAARDLAANHRWSWHAPSRALLDTLPGAGSDRHPLAALDALGGDAVTSWAEAHRDEIEACHRSLRADLDAAPDPSIAYYSPEFGIASQVPQYSGGLGILAGDHLKAAGDVGVPLVGVGLLYRVGFFHQEISDGAQVERYELVDPVSIGAVDTGVTVTVPVAGAEVAARVWRQMVGPTQLILLDTDVDGNDAGQRAITDRLYSGDRRHRLSQELVLGVGGVRAIRALGLAIEVHHLNEGHACFLLLELLAEHVAGGADLHDAVDAVRSCTLFTTHTPVPAGIDRFERRLIEPELRPWARRLGTDVATLMSWATLPSDPKPRPFNTAALAFELCGRANGVSQLHAQVSRRLFADLPRARHTEGITNGVHARTWVDPQIQVIYDETLGPGWENGDAGAWARVGSLRGDRIAEARAAARTRLVDVVRSRAGVGLADGVATIGFARRFATYKRASLLLRERDALVDLLDAGARFVFAGKAHPADDEGKAVLAEVAAFAASPEATGRFVLVPDYDIAVARAMYGGCDVWLNTPIRPHEACGTSGEKSALNGGLNCSILDGWWADWYVDGIGWAIPTSDLDDEEERNDAEAAALVALLADQVLPTVADPAARWSMVEAMLAHLGPLVTAGRMVREYDGRFYRAIAPR